MRTSTRLAACLAAAALATTLAAGCAAAEPDRQQDTRPAGATPTTAAPARPPEQPAEQWTMPDLVGSVLQDAQDRIQSLTGGEVTISTSHDATGQHRTQVLDRNWKVCTQSLAPGAPITPDTLIDFGAVKLDESCP